jgi:hypothetical protein
MRNKTELGVMQVSDRYVSKPFSGIILDTAFADKTQVELFSAIGRTKGPFQGVIDWPCLNSVITDRAIDVLKAEGESVWKDAGGTYGPDGKPTFSCRSDVAAGLVKEIASKEGGFIWMDKDGDGWAVSLLPVDGREHVYGGLAISWNGGGRWVDPLARAEYRRVVEEKMAELDATSETETRRRLQKLADQIWLYERAEQLLWAIHAAVLMQKNSVVLVPDVALGEIIWGAERSAWPDNWRQTVADILWSLSRLHVATMHIGKANWQPRFTMRSVAVAHVEHLETSRKQQGFCKKCCPLWNAPDRHGHFLIQIGYGFLGVLESFAITDDQHEVRRFDFHPNPTGPASKLVKEAQKAGAIVPVHLPTKVFGPSDWSGLSRGQCGIIQGIVGEVTRVVKRTTSSRQDRAEIVCGSLVPGVRGKGQVVCDLLRAERRYVAFNGNGHRRGKGYLIVGRKKGGWLAKCGYLTGNVDPEGLVPQFLDDLAVVAGILDLTVVGIYPRSGQWLDLEQMKQLAAFPKGLERLQEVHLRIYGPEDYLERCRRFIAERGSFAAIPGENTPVVTSPSQALLDDEGLDLRIRMKQKGITLNELARHLGISKPFVSAALNGKKSWPPDMKERIESYVTTFSGHSKVVEAESCDPVLYSSA